MNDRDDAKSDGNPMRELVPVSAILAVLVALFLGAEALANGNMENDGYLRILTLPLTAAFAACVGRVVAVSDLGMPARFKISVSSLLIAFVSAIPELFPGIIEIETLVPFTFATVGIATMILVNSNRREESNLLLTAVIGFYLAVSLVCIYGLRGRLMVWIRGRTDRCIEICSLTSVLFAFWASSISMGLILAISMRGSLDKPGEGKLFSSLPSFDFSKEASRLIVAILGVIFLVQMLPLIWLLSISGDTIIVDGQVVSNALTKYSEHEYLGSIWAMATTVVIFMWAFFRSEKWQVLAALTAVNWILYSARKASGNRQPSWHRSPS